MNNDVEIQALKTSESETNGYPLQGTDSVYINPTEPVALEDWEALSDFIRIKE